MTLQRRVTMEVVIFLMDVPMQRLVIITLRLRVTMDRVQRMTNVGSVVDPEHLDVPIPQRVTLMQQQHVMTAPASH
jgi:hypothetical protein